MKYDRATRALHWTQAALILSLVALGWWMVGLTYYDRWYNDALYWHRALGVAVPALAACQLGWRWLRVTPPPVVSGWQRRAASAMHRLFLVLMFAVPISGYLISTSAGAPVPLPFGVALPAVVAVTDAVRDAAIAAHYYLAYATAALAVVHAAAALKHHFINRDQVLRRMV